MTIGPDIKPPNFFILGAPKCGTTALSEYLRSHPDVYISRPKEPNYFNSDMPSRKLYQYTSFEDYLGRCFPKSARYRAVGEASARYLTSSVAVGTILRRLPGAKFIVILRNPVEMGHSQFRQHLRDDNEDVATYEEAWHLQEVRRRGKNIPANCAHPSILWYDERCRLGDQLEALFAHVPDRQRILIIPFNEFARDTRKVYSDVLAFLGLPPDGRTHFPVINEYGKVRSKALERVLGISQHHAAQAFSKAIKKRLGITNWRPLLWLARNNYRVLPKQPMSEEFRSYLTEHFRPDVEKVKRLTGIDLYESS